MPLTTFAKNKQADAIAYDFASLHTGAPTDDGSQNEITTVATQQQIDDGKPAYARKAVTFAAAVDGGRDSQVAPVFDIPAGTTVKFYCLWEGDECVAVEPVENDETYGGQGKYTLEDIDISNT